MERGTAFNGVVEELKKLTTSVAHVLPVSDDGGSTAEIVRVFGGPAVGDIRSRCLRLSDQSTSEALAVRTLLGFRLPLDAQQAKLEWYSIVEGEHPLWKDVSKPYRETIRAFLAYFPEPGARIFFQSLDAAIFLFSRSATDSDIKESLVLPVISTNDRLTLGCGLWTTIGVVGSGIVEPAWARVFRRHGFGFGEGWEKQETTCWDSEVQLPTMGECGVG
ncbi:maternal effect embryo arrest 18 [Tanacetum coccineum]